MAKGDWPVGDFRALLDHVLNETGLSQVALASLVPIDQSQLSRWKSGASRPSYNSLVDLGESLKSSHPGIRVGPNELLESAGYTTHRSGSVVTGAAGGALVTGLAVDDSATAEDSATVTKSPVIPDEPPPDLPRVLAARYLNFTATERAILWLPGATPGEREQLVSIWQAVHKLTTDAAAAQAAKDEAQQGTVSEMKRRP